MQIRNRIKELRQVKASELLPNPRNWRRHPAGQADALRGALAEIGYADALIAYETPDGLMLIDGHLRAETTPDMEVPVLVTDLDEGEANKLLMTLDPLAAMAERDEEQFAELCHAVSFDNGAITAMLNTMMNNGIVPLDWADVLEHSGDTADVDAREQMTFVLSANDMAALRAVLNNIGGDKNAALMEMVTAWTK